MRLLLAALLGFAVLPLQAEAPPPVRVLRTGGLKVEGAALLVFGHFGPRTPLAAVALGFAAVGVGLGIFQVPNMARVMGGFPPSRGQEDNLVQIRVSLKPHDHACLACFWRRASAIFW